MAKNFTDFQYVSGSFEPASYDVNDPIKSFKTGTTVTQATTGMHLVGYDTDLPHGERQYTIESVLLAAEPYHVGLENVTNESKEFMFLDSAFTGDTTMDNLYLNGNLHVEGSTTKLNTSNIATSSFDITNYGSDVALTVTQYGPNTVARFNNGDDVSLDINENGNIGIGIQGDPNTKLTIVGSVSVIGDTYTTGRFDGRKVSADGAKLDNIQPWADVTSLNLSNVYDRMEFLKANSTEFTTIEPARGFDLLEDGDNFKKIPSLSSVPYPGIGDYSHDKIRSVEYQADVTRDHSGDIIFNEVPDGPWTGNENTSFVKMTSAEHDRLNSIRGVSYFLYNGDDAEDITAQHIVASYHESYPNFWSTADELEYRGTIIPKLDSVFSNVEAISSRRDMVINKVEQTQANWDSTHSSVLTTSANWDSTHSSVLTTSSNWDSTHSSVLTTSANWDSTHSSVLTTSANWDYAHSKVKQMEDEWDSTYNTTLANSAEWSASVNNAPNPDGSDQSLQAGHADLLQVTITEGLTAQSDTRLGGEVFVLRDGQWSKGLTVQIPLGNDMLYFVDGMLVEWDKDVNA